MAIKSSLGVMVIILLLSSASWHYLNTANKNTNQPQFTQGFLKGVAIPQNKYLKADIVINNYHLQTDIAGTSQQQQTGLAIKSQLNENQAMLFPFADESYQAFWMKDMKFPIDIMWVDKNNTIVYVQPHLPPCATVLNCPIYQPDVKVIYVLEVVSGFAQQHHVVVGQTKMYAKLVN